MRVGLDLRLLVPRNGQKQVEIVAHDGGFRRHRAHLLQLLQFGIRLFAGLLGQLRLGDALFQFGHFITAVLALAEFLLNGLHLLIQIILALGLLHLALYARADALFDLQNRDLAFHEAERLFEPALHAHRFKHFLLFGDLDRQMRGNGIGELRVVLDLACRTNDFRRDLLVQLDVVLELRDHRTGQRLDLDGIVFRLGENLGGRLVKIFTARVIVDLGAGAALDQNLHGAIGQLQKLENIGDRAHLVDGGRSRIVIPGIDLGDEHDLLVGAHDLFQRANGFLAPDEQRYDHVGEDHNVAQRQDRIDIPARCRRRCIRHVISFHSSRFRELARPQETGTSFLPKVEVLTGLFKPCASRHSRKR